MHNSDSAPHTFDVVVIGGGPAGLQAALTLGRVRYRVVLLDSGAYRNGSVAHAHNLIGHDGRSPAELRARARDELSAYDTVEVRDARVMAIQRARAEAPFTVTTTSGDTLAARRVILATGMRDDLPDVSGIEQLWGREVAQCPFCHGYELTGRPIAVLGEPPHVLFQEAMLRRIGSEVTVFAPDAVVAVERTDAGVRLELADGTSREAAGLFVAAQPRQAAPFAAALGCTVLPSGSVEVDANGRTGVPGLYAAGDMAHPATQPGPVVSLAGAIAAGQLAAIGVVRDALED